MADRHTAPSQSDQASNRSKAEGEREDERAAGRDAGRDPERDAGRDAGGDAGREVTGRDAGREAGREVTGRDALRTGRGGLDPTEVRNVLDETSEKHRRGEDVGASGLSNPTLAEEQEEQAEVPPRRTRKAGGA